MATQFIDKANGGTAATEITDTANMRARVRNTPGAAGFVYDEASKTFKYNGSGEIRTLGSNYRRAITPTAARTLTAGESGSTVFLNAAAGFAITLPTPSAGLYFRFVTAAAFATTDFTVVTHDNSNIIFGMADVNSTLVPADAEDTINFVATAELPGDWVEVESDGTNWYVRGQAATVGAITFTAAA